jgi:hypothetical protein
VREGLLGFSGLEANLSFCGFIERSLQAPLVHRVQLMERRSSWLIQIKE